MKQTGQMTSTLPEGIEKFVFFGALAFVGFALAFAVKDYAFTVKDVEGSLGGSRFKIEQDGHKFEYELGPMNVFSGVLTMTGAQRGISEGGAMLTLHYLSHADRDKFRRTYAGEQCPAPFFNGHARQRILIPASAQISKKLRAIDFDDYRNSTQWRDFSLRGQCVISAPVAEINGRKVGFPRNMFDNCLTMVVTGIEINNP
jgi:hypothetical protein